MQTRSSSKIVGEPSTNPTSTIPKRRNRRRSKQTFSLEENPVVTMADQRTIEQLLQAPTKGYGDVIVIPAILAENYELKHGLLNLVTSKLFYGFEKEDPHAHIHCEAWERFKDLLRACPHHGFTKLHHLDTFYNALTPTDQDSLNAAAGGNLLTKTPRNTLTIIEKKSKVRNSRNKPVATKRTPPPASVKAVEEICVTCGGPHLYYQSAVNYNQGNTGYRPQGVANQIRPPGFAQPNVQNNQKRFNYGYNQNKGNPVYQAPMQQTQVAPSNELSNYKKMIDTNIKAMQNQINNVKNELRNEMKTSIQTSMSNQTNELNNMMASFFQMNTASSSGSGSLPSNTIANPKGELKAITTRSGMNEQRRH
ncbi:hypothetical protein Tco_1139304 [Tanacetum coccineum]